MGILAFFASAHYFDLASLKDEFEGPSWPRQG